MLVPSSAVGAFIPNSFIICCLERETKPMLTSDAGHSHNGLIGIRTCDHPLAGPIVKNPDFTVLLYRE